MKFVLTRAARPLCAALIAIAFAGAASAQRIPASSSDSGRRAVVAIDQASINNNINNAQNTANYAVGVGNNAQNTANWAGAVGQNAQRTADAAMNSASSGAVLSQFSYSSGSNGGWNAYGLCIRGWNPDAASQYTTNRPCPEGTGPWVVSATQNPGGNGE